jgi:hypothetical protein
MLRQAAIAVSLGLAGGAVAHAQAPADPRAVAFRDDCTPVLFSLVETQKHIKAAGWAPMDPASRAELKKVYDHRRMMSPEPGVSFDTYSRTVGESRLYMLIRGNVPIDSYYRKNVCEIYDFDDKLFAPDPDADHTIERWLGAPPTEDISRPGDAAVKAWDRFRHHPDLWRVSVQIISANSPGKWWVFKGRYWAAEAGVRR